MKRSSNRDLETAPVMPCPLGPTWIDNEINFAVATKDADRLTFALFEENNPGNLFKEIVLLFLLCSCLVLTQGFALIVESPTLDTFEGALASIDQETLVLFDVDETLIVSKDLILRPCARNLWKKYAKEAYENLEISPAPYLDNHILGLILPKMDYELVHPRVVSIIHALQQQNIKTIAFTKMMTGAYGSVPCMEDWRIAHLKQLGMDFSGAFPQFQKVEIHPLRTGPPSLFKEGLLCANRQDKGPVLVAFLKSIDWKPSKILFLDNRYDYLQSVESALQGSGIEFLGFYYTEVEKRPCTIDSELAKFQFEHLAKTGIWLNDVEAMNDLSSSR